MASHFLGGDPVSVFTAVRRSRVRRECANCRESIEPGQQYERHTVSPNYEHNDDGEWRAVVAHLPAECPLGGASGSTARREGSA